MTTSPAPSLCVLGCGYVGTALCLQAQAAGWQVTGVVRTEASRARLAALGVPAIRADIVAGELASVPGTFDAIVYAASAGGGGLDGYRSAYVDGLAQALSWAATVGARAFVFTSSTGVYRQDGEVDESSAAGGSPTADLLLAGEALVLESSFATRAVLRLGGLYGPGRHYLWFQIANGNRVIAGPSAHRINYLHREDAASAALLAAAAPPGSYLLNVTDGQPVVKADLARWMCDRLGVLPPTFYAAATPAMRPRAGEATPPDRRIGAQKARDVLGWRPQFASVYDGLAAEYPQREQV